MALRSNKEQGVWCPHRAREIEQDLARLLEILDDVEELRSSIPYQAWAAHEKLWKLQLSILDRRITHLMTMQGMAPEKNGLSNLSTQQLREKLDEYQKQLAHFAKTMSGGAQVIKIA